MNPRNYANLSKITDIHVCLNKQLLRIIDTPGDVQRILKKMENVNDRFKFAQIAALEMQREKLSGGWLTFICAMKQGQYPEDRVVDTIYGFIISDQNPNLYIPIFGDVYTPKDKRMKFNLKTPTFTEMLVYSYFPEEMLKSIMNKRDLKSNTIYTTSKDIITPEDQVDWKDAGKADPTKEQNALPAINLSGEN